MVFKGQDAWRKHPLISNCHSKPFPAFGTAVLIFAGYCITEYYIKMTTAPPPSYNKPKYEYIRDDTNMELFDQPPQIKYLGKHH